MADQNQNPNQQGQQQQQQKTGAGAGEEQPKIKVEVRAKADAGFRRMGQHFGTSPREIEVTEEEYEQQLKNEGQLIVRRLDGRDQQQQAGQAPTGQAGGATGGGSGTPSGQQGAQQAGQQGRYDTSGQLGAPTGTGGHTPGTSTLAEGKPVGDEQGAGKRK